MFKQELRKHLRRFYSSQELTLWFDPLEINLDEENRFMVICFPHEFFYQWFQHNIGYLFEERINSSSGGPYVIQYQHRFGSNKNYLITPHKNNAPRDYPFGQDYTFKNFICMPNASMLLNSAQRIAESREILFNPYMVCGESGSGKSHILRAMANELAGIHGETAIFFSDIEEFKGIYKEKFQGDALSARTYLDSFKIIFIENIHKIASDDFFQNELLIIFEMSIHKNRLMVFSCADNCLISNAMDKNLKDRLSSGLIVYTEKPDLPTRVAYINQLCLKYNLHIPKRQILAMAIQSENLFHLQGTFRSVLAHKQILDRNISEESIEKILAGKKILDQQPIIQAKHIISAVSEHYGIPKNELTGKKRNASIMLPRQLAIFLCRNMAGFSYPEIGTIFGGKDHTTIMHSVKKIVKLLYDDHEMNQTVLALKKKCSYLADFGK